MPGIFDQDSTVETTEEVLRLLIERMKQYNAEKPSAYNEECINHLRQAFYALEKSIEELNREA